MVTRRGFLGSIIAMAAAPAIVKASSLMPGKVWTPPTFKVVERFGDGFMDVRGWAEWNALYISKSQLWTPQESLEFIAKHNSFDDKPYRLSLTQAGGIGTITDFNLENYMKP